MEGKKKYIIAIILFIFIGLMVFTFANPSEEDDIDLDGGNKKDRITEKSTIDSNSTNNTANNNNTTTTDGILSGVRNRIIPNNIVRNINNAMNVIFNINVDETDNSYELALRAVENAEDALDEESYNNALALVEKVTNLIGRSELANRLNDVKNSIDVKALVATLTTKTTTAQNIDDMKDARDYRIDSEVIEKVGTLTNTTLKEELQEQLKTLSKLLDDNDVAEINIADEAILNTKDFEITINDDNEFTATLKNTETEEEQEISNGYQIKEEGYYELTVVDAAFNTVTVKFTVDWTAPVYKSLGIVNISNYPNGTLDYAKLNDKLRLMITFEEKLAEEPVVTIGENTYKATYREQSSSEENYAYYADINVTDQFVDGIINFEITGYSDKAQNEGVRLTDENINNSRYPKVIVDKTIPTAKIGGSTGNKYWHKAQTFNVTITEDNLDSVYYAWNKSSNDKNMKKVLDSDAAIKVELDDLVDNGDGTYTLTITEDNKNGSYVFNIKMIDKAGNVNYQRKGWYNFDNIAPEITEVKNGGIYKEVKPEIIDTNIKSIKLNNEDYVSGTSIKIEGKYELVATDKAGNTTTVSFEIDRTKPIVKGVENNGYYNHDVTPEIIDANLQNVAVKFNGEVKNPKYVMGETLTKEGTYQLRASDKAGNKFDYITFTIDKTIPTLNVGNGEIFTNKTIEADDVNFDYMTIQKQGFDKEPRKVTEKTFELSKEDADNVRYDIVVYDKAGNKTKTVNLYQDNVKPIISANGLVAKESTEVENNGYYQQTTIKVTDGSLKKVEVIKDGDSTVSTYADNYKPLVKVESEEMIFIEDGNYKIVATDRNNNVSELEFNIDTKATKISTFNIYVSGSDNASSNTFAKKKDNIRIVLHADEEFVTIPTLNIDGNRIKDFSRAEAQDTDKLKVYYVDYTVPNNIENNKPFTFEITNLIDKAGNGVIYKNNEYNTLTNDVIKTITYDIEKPILTVKDNYVGNKEKNIYSNVSFGLEDKLSYIQKININGQELKYSANQWGDSNYNNIVSHLTEGKNKITLFDLAGNTQKLEFTYDVTAPTFTYKVNPEGVNRGPVTVTLTASEDIEDIEGWTRVDGKTFTKEYSSNIKDNITISDYAKNTFTKMVEVKRIDADVPYFVGLENNGIYNHNVTYKVDKNGNTDNVDFAIVENSVKSIIIDGVTYKESRDIQTISGEGQHTIKVIDKAGNESETITFNIDTIAPIIKVKDNYVGTKEKNIFSNVSFKLTDENSGIIRATVNGNKLKDYTVAKSGDMNFNNIRTYLNEGENVVVLYDKAGNASEEYKFTYDITAPQSVSTTYSETTLTNKSVTVNIRVNEELQEIDGWNLSEDKKTIFKTFDENITSNIEISDLAGNKVTRYFKIAIIDKVKPTVEFRNSTKNEDGKYTTLNIHAEDNVKLKSVLVNPTKDANGEYILAGSNNWWTDMTSINKKNVDANYGLINSQLVDGTNTIVVIDMAGNVTESVIEFAK